MVDTLAASLGQGLLVWYAAGKRLAGELGIRPGEQTMFVCHSDCPEDARYVAERVKERFGTKEFYFHDIGPVIGSHTGGGCVSIFFLGEHR